MKVYKVYSGKVGCMCGWYNPQQAFDAMMNKPEILAVFKRLSVR